ncbi:MAG: peptide ABC transporter substrate-binding protein [Chloroflexota bacterium]
MLKTLRSLVFTLLVVSNLLAASCLPLPTATAPSGAGVLNLYGSDPNTLDPAVSGEMTSHQYIMQIFNGLLRLDDKLEPAADIAEKWDISPDGKTYTFYLRSNAKFHNGRDVKAQDFKYSWERACDPATGSLTAGTYLNDIVGAADVLSGQKKDISGIKVINDRTLQVTIDSPKSYFLSKLTYPTAFVVDEENVKTGSNWWHKPNGTGPFKLKEWQENSLLTLEKNSAYYGKVANVNAVVFKILSGVPMNMYETGEIDATDVSLDYIDRATDKNGPFYKEMSEVPELSFSYIGFNCSKPPFYDANVRRAFTQAIDKKKLVSLVFKDTVQVAEGILPAGLPGYNENLRGLDFDINKAKESIRQSRYGDVSKLPPITVTTAGYGGFISSGLEAVIDQWRQNLGVEVKVRQLEPQRYYYHLKEEKDEMFDMGWIADYPHPQDFVDILFRRSGSINYGDYGNTEVDTLLDRAGVEQDRNKSFALYQEAEQKLVNDAACIPLWFGRNYILVKPYVKGYTINPLGFATLNQVTIEPH